MIRTLLSLCALVSSLLALSFGFASATPMSQSAGSAHITLTVSPDPPRVGSNDFIIQITGAPDAILAKTAVRYSTLMPKMNMTGPSGAATRTSANSWHFKAMLGMAAWWSIHVSLSGGVNGNATFNYNVGARNGSAMQGRAYAPQPVASNNMTNAAPMAGMNMNAGNTSAWETAFFALLVAVVIAYFIARRDRRPVAIALGIVAIAAILVLAFAQARYGAQPMDMNSMSAAQGSAPTPVTLATIGSNADTQAISAPANVQPYFTQNIVARTSGLLSDLTAYTGDRIAAGQVVAHLNEPELQSNAQAAQAAARAAQSQAAAAEQSASATTADLSAAAEQVRYWNAELKREKMLLAAGAVSTQEYQNERAQAAAARSGYDAARAKIAAARSTARSAQAQVSQASSTAQAQNIMAGYTSVVVPDDAVVIKRLVDPGVYVQAGTPILQVAVISRLRIQAQVAQTDIASVHIGAPIDVSFDDGQTLHGRISSISPVADPTTHTAIAEAIVQNPGNRLQPGGFVRVLIQAQRVMPSNTFSVPSASIVGGASSAVWVNAAGAAHRVPVTVISDDGTSAQVQGTDLRSGMRVVVIGAQSLEEGQPITGSAQ